MTTMTRALAVAVEQRACRDADPDRSGQEPLGRVLREREEEAAPQPTANELVDHVRRSLDP